MTKNIINTLKNTFSNTASYCFKTDKFNRHSFCAAHTRILPTIMSHFCESSVINSSKQPCSFLA